MLPLRVRVNLGAMAMKRGLLHIPQISKIGNLTSEGLMSYLGHSMGLTPLQRSSPCILQPQLTGQVKSLDLHVNTQNPRNSSIESFLGILNILTDPFFNLNQAWKCNRKMGGIPTGKTNRTEKKLVVNIPGVVICLNLSAFTSALTNQNLN